MNRERRANAVAASASVQEVTRDGRAYLSLPVVPLVEGVLDYPEHGTRELLPAASIRETVAAWAGAPITYRHPENRERTATHPDAYTGVVIGSFHDPELVDGAKLRGHALIDVAKANALGAAASEVVERLRAGEQLSVSAGYATVDDTRTQGTHGGETYTLVQGPLLPDHIAIFPSDEFTARCAPADGCAAPRANAVETPPGDAANRAARPAVRAETEADSEMTMHTNGGETVFESKIDRMTALTRFADEQDATPLEAEHALSTQATQDEDPDMLLYLGARNAGWQPDGCSCDDLECEHTLAAVAASVERANAAHDGTCDCTSGPSSELAPEDDPAFTDGGDSRTNYAGIPGRVARASTTDDDVSEYPAGGRAAWEARRKRRENQAPDTDAVPTGTRSSWERRGRANSGSVDPGLAVPSPGRARLLERRRGQAQRHGRNGV